MATDNMNSDKRTQWNIIGFLSLLIMIIGLLWGDGLLLRKVNTADPTPSEENSVVAEESIYIPEDSSVYDPITYNSGTAKHILDATIIHFPDIKLNDYLIGGTWTLQPDFTEADPYSLCFQDQRGMIVDATGRTICDGEIQFGTVWSENDPNYTVSDELVSPFTNNPLPKESFGTFVFDLSSLETTAIGDYYCQLIIQLNGSIYTAKIPITLG